jgi:hypothetical protein
MDAQAGTLALTWTWQNDNDESKIGTKCAAVTVMGCLLAVTARMFTLNDVRNVNSWETGMSTRLGRNEQ